MVLVSDDRGLLLFDGDCGICTKMAARAAGIDRQRRFRIEPYQAFSDEQLAPHGLSHASCNRAIKLIRANTKVSSGAFAVNRFLMPYAPWKFLLPWAYLLFPALIVEAVGYWIIARNRHRISRWMGLDACKIGAGQATMVGGTVNGESQASGRS